MSASSDHETSESAGSPRSYLDLDSPYSSPSQQVPNLANGLTELSVRELHQRGLPYLKMIVEPQQHFRFRYKSEMQGTHGCLQGRPTNNKKVKIHPTVELMNYNNRAMIQCSLVQANCDDEHPHQLLDEDQEKLITTEVPENGCYRKAFAGIGIIYRAQKEIPQYLYNKLVHKRNSGYNDRQLKTHCETMAKNIDLNLVRLKFSAYDVHTGKEICPPVYSQPIRNEKSAKTNNLKICRMSKVEGTVKGGDDVFIFTEKVNKKNIEIRFFELTEDGRECWSAKASFMPTDVHHQYAIVFRTPSYPKTEITSKQVFLELVRTSDGERSEPKVFTYHRDQSSVRYKRRKQNSESLDSSGSWKSWNDIPVTVARSPAKQIKNENDIINDVSNNTANKFKNENDIINDVSLNNTIPHLPQTTKNDVNLGDAVFNTLSHYNDNQVVTQVSPLPAATDDHDHDMNFKITSSDYEKLLQDTHMRSEEKKQFMNEYCLMYDDKLFDECPSASNIVADSGRRQGSGNVADSNVNTISIDDEYTACYTDKDGAEVKQLVDELCQMLRNKTGQKKHVARAKLKRLFELRLSNGDTFLHMTLQSHPTSLVFIVKVIRSLKMTHLINFTNNDSQTVLHVAIQNDMTQYISLFVSNGCDPSIKDINGNNAFHYAVTYNQTCLRMLLDAVKKMGIRFDINAFNNKQQTPLHLAAISQRQTSESCIRYLLLHGADVSAKDHDGRTALHLAAYDGCLPALTALLEMLSKSQVDMTDARCNTALQIVCGTMTTNTPAMAKLLLEKGADPTKQDGQTQSALKLCADKQDLIALFSSYLPSEQEIKIEPEEDFLTADEEEYQSKKKDGMNKLSLYLDELATYLNRSGAWRELVKRLGQNFQLSLFEESRDPSKALLTSISEMDGEMSSQHLSKIMEDMGHVEAAKIIRKYVVDC